MARTASSRSRNIEDLFTLKTREMEPGFQWVRRESDGDSGPAYLQRMPVVSGTRVRIVARQSKRDVRQALNAFRKLAQQYDHGLRDKHGISEEQLMSAIARIASRYGTLYGDMPRSGTLAVGTLDDWKVELLRFVDLWELAQALRYRSWRQAVTSRIEVRHTPERFVFRPRTADLDGDIPLTSTAERYMWIAETSRQQEDVPIFRRMRDGNSRTRLWITFGTLVNQRMKGRLNLASHPFETSSASVGIAPDGLLGTAITRLWLDVVTANEGSTPHTRKTCAHCGIVLPETATSRMKYCDGTCRKTHHRQAQRS